MIWLSASNPENGLPPDDIREKLFSVLPKMGPFKRVLIIPPDYTRSIP